MKKVRKKRNWGRIFVISVLISFIVPAGYLLLRIISGDTLIDSAGGRGREDYVLMLLQCLLGVVAILVPVRMMHRWDVQIPRVMFLMYIAFLYCAIFLGEVQSFYYRVPHWDTILHTCSGAMLGALGFSMITIFNNTERIPINLSPLFVALFAFCFALALGGVWEIYEYAADCLLGTNMQKFALDDGTQLLGQAALRDTMKDIIVDAIGAVATSTIGYISLKYKKGWIEKMIIRIGKSKKNEKEKETAK
ncbi:MAG: hypothetical protein J6I98_03955 [Clostridia bacterium]|nr:hypothetical protein [Clostridia bacterium]